jgi:TRAP-type C4-dicarboxylate transport system substrate-binding protein
VKKIIGLVICVLLIAAFVLVGCAPAATSTSPSSPAATTPAAAKPIELRFSSHIPPFAPQVALYKEWAEEINKNTNGQVKITVYAGGTLLQPMDVITGIKSNIADMAEVINEMVANERPLTPILNLPFMGLGDWQNAKQIMDKLSADYPALANEWKDFKTLFRIIRTGTMIHDKTAIRVPTDLKGKKIQATGILADIVNAQGGSAVTLNIPDWFTSLDRGLIEGMFMDIGAVYEVKVYTMMPNHTDFPKGMSVNIGQAIMNLDTWNKLPPNVQKVIDDASAKLTTKIAQMTVDVNAGYIANIKKEGGHNFIMLSQDEADKWFAAASTEHQKYLAKAEAKGMPAKAIYEAALKLAGGK